MDSPPHALCHSSRSCRGCPKGSLQVRAVAKQRWDQEWEEMLKGAYSLHCVGGHHSASHCLCILGVSIPGVQEIQMSFASQATGIPLFSFPLRAN